MIKPPIAVDASSTKNEIGRQKSTVSARSRSRSVGKPKLESNLDKQSFKPVIKIDKETRDGDLPSRKQSVTGSQVSRQRSRSLGKPKLDSKLPFKSSIKLNDETRDWNLPSRKQSSTSSYKAAIRLNDDARDWDVPSRKQSTTSALSRQRSRLFGKPKLESSLSKLPFKSSTKVNEIRDGDLPSRKSSTTSNRVKRFSSQSSVVADDTRSLASTTENVIYDTKYRPTRTSSFSGYKSSTALHKVSSSRLPSVSSRYSRLSTAVDPRSLRKPKTSQYKVGDVQSYKLHDELETTDEEAFDSEFTDEAEQNEEGPEDEAGGAEGAAPENPEGEAGEGTAEGEPGDDPEGGGGGRAAEAGELTGDKVLLQFLVLAVICKAVSLFFQPHKCTC